MSTVGIEAAEQASRIVVVDDDAAHGTAVALAVGPLTRRVERATTVAEALTAIAGNPPDLVILDLGLPDGDGIEVLGRLRAAGSAPVLVCSGRTDESDKVALLDAGADDFVTKPVGEAELIARVRALLRRARLGSSAPAPDVVVAGDLRIDFAGQTVAREGLVRKLTPTETALLKALVENAGRTMTHRQLWDAVWEREFGDARLHLRVHVTHLRRKVERDPALPQLIVTDPGVGYRFERM